MRRDRFPGRPIRRPIRGLAARRPVPPKLREANQLYSTGDYEKAAGLYVQMAQRAEQNRLPQAANLYMRAGISYLKYGDLAQTQALLQKSFQYCIDRKRWPQLQRILKVASAELDAAGQTDLKSDLYTWAHTQLLDANQTFPDIRDKANEPSTQAVALPAHCPNCGGPVQPNEVEWYDSENPICAFCGSILKND
ncbi:hypothetical protein [Pelolinea submarina]|uniref:Tetratricopeptide repeat protein n=1 Tax=Pelolinea submarina TaxID=913107 RepID=A0A347ZT82_9CHLR|nr:hypothetical protein [Pelolinea submarina]REG10912.1 hypothetical protein DFR64_0780 [Pelolinea submarina]BBB48513.1 hypothetical protein Pelsub_P1741 [Pelolinea submarina]